MSKKKLYKTIAKQYGVSVSEVKQDMQTAINEAYKNPNATASAAPRKGKIPTLEEFIDYSVKMIDRDKTK